MLSTTPKVKKDKTSGNLLMKDKDSFIEETEWGWQNNSIGLIIVLNKMWDRYYLLLFISENRIEVLKTLNEKQIIEDDYRIIYL